MIQSATRKMREGKQLPVIENNMRREWLFYYMVVSNITFVYEQKSSLLEICLSIVTIS